MDDGVGTDGTCYLWTVTATLTETLARLALLVNLLLNFIIGVRLLRLAERTRQIPELALGLGHLLGGALGWALVLFGYVMIIGFKLPVAGIVVAMSGMFCLNVGNAAGALFSWRVFHPQSRWVAALFCTIAALLIADFVHNGLYLHQFAPPTNTFWYWPGCLARSGTYVWMTSVTLNYYRKLRKRLPLGLAEPIATNRMFLIFLAASMTVLLAIVVTLGSLFKWWASHPNLMYSVSSFLGMPSVFCSWLAYVPPRSYVAWIARRAPPVMD